MRACVGAKSNKGIREEEKSREREEGGREKGNRTFNIGFCLRHYRALLVSKRILAAF